MNGFSKGPSQFNTRCGRVCIPCLWCPSVRFSEFGKRCALAAGDRLR